MLTRIASEGNSRLKLVRKLAAKKTRDEEGKFVIEGINLVEEAVMKDVDVDYILVSDEFKAEAFLEKCDAEGIPVFEVRAAIFEKLCNAENGVGILAVVRKPDAIHELPDKEANILVLDRVQDPGNIGTMIRTAVAAGYGMIVAVKGTADVYSAKVLRSTAGMIFDIPVIYVNDAEEVRELVDRTGHRLVVTDPAGGKPYYEEDINNGVALVIGNEGNGISDELMSIADIRVTIPMRGDIESLNAAISAAILMYEAIRVRGL